MNSSGESCSTHLNVAESALGGAKIGLIDFGIAGCADTRRRCSKSVANGNLAHEAGVAKYMI